MSKKPHALSTLSRSERELLAGEIGRIGTNPRVARAPDAHRWDPRRRIPLYLHDPPHRHVAHGARPEDGPRGDDRARLGRVTVKRGLPTRAARGPHETPSCGRFPEALMTPTRTPSARTGPGHRARRARSEGPLRGTGTVHSTAGSPSEDRSSRGPSSRRACSARRSSSGSCCITFRSSNATRSAAAATSPTLPRASTSPVGHRVRIAETRPLSKLVSFCIVEDLGEAARRVRGEEPVEAPAPPATAKESP